MKLISMTEYVIEQEHKIYEEDMQFLNDRLCNIIKYAQFLQQPLTLGMFVPCVDGVPIEEPESEYCCSGLDCGCQGLPVCFEYYEYQQAKEKVLFEGFEEWNSAQIMTMVNNSETIEYLTKFNPTLTKSALKQIGI